MGNPVTDFVQSSRELSPVHAYVADHGKAVNSGEITCETIAGRSVAVSDDLTSDERELVADALRATEPGMKACFANTLQMWNFDDRFKYAEGFAVVSGLEINGIEHAWCMLDGSKLVDVTQPFDHYYAVVITDDDTLQRYYDIGKNHGSYRIVSNHVNHFQFLRERGYIDG